MTQNANLIEIEGYAVIVPDEHVEEHDGVHYFDLSPLVTALQRVVRNGNWTEAEMRNGMYRLRQAGRIR